MTHRAETVLDALTTELSGLTTTGTRVARGRVWPREDYPALSIYKGADVASDDEDVIDTIVRELTFNVVIQVKQTGNPETHLNAIAAEVFAALAANPTLGVDWIFDVEFVEDEEPEIEDAQDMPVASMVTIWKVFYEHSETNAEA